MRVKGKPDIIGIIVKKRLQRYGHVKRMPEDSIPKLITEWIPKDRRKRGRQKKTWMEGVQAAMTTIGGETGRYGVRFTEDGDSGYKNRIDRYRYR
jgi:hypothetical protein